MPLFDNMRGGLPYYSGYTTTPTPEFKPMASMLLAQYVTTPRSAQSSTKKSDDGTSDNKNPYVGGTIKENLMVQDNLGKIEAKAQNIVNEMTVNAEKTESGDFQTYYNSNDAKPYIQALNQLQQDKTYWEELYIPQQNENLKNLETTNEKIKATKAEDELAMKYENGQWVPLIAYNTEGNISGVTTNKGIMDFNYKSSGYYKDPNKGIGYTPMTTPDGIGTTGAFDKWLLTNIESMKMQSREIAGTSRSGGSITTRSDASNIKNLESLENKMLQTFKDDKDVYADISRQAISYARNYNLPLVSKEKPNGFTQAEQDAATAALTGRNYDPQAYSSFVERYAKNKIDPTSEIYKNTTASESQKDDAGWLASQVKKTSQPTWWTAVHIAHPSLAWNTPFKEWQGARKVEFDNARASILTQVENSPELAAIEASVGKDSPLYISKRKEVERTLTKKWLATANITNSDLNDLFGYSAIKDDKNKQITVEGVGSLTKTRPGLEFANLSSPQDAIFIRSAVFRAKGDKDNASEDDLYYGLDLKAANTAITKYTTIGGRIIDVPNMQSAVFLMPTEVQDGHVDPYDKDKTMTTVKGSILITADDFKKKYGIKIRNKEGAVLDVNGAWLKDNDLLATYGITEIDKITDWIDEDSDGNLTGDAAQYFKSHARIRDLFKTISDANPNWWDDEYYLVPANIDAAAGYSANLKTGQFSGGTGIEEQTWQALINIK